MNTKDLAWAGGLFDGEGSAGIYKLKRKTAKKGYYEYPRIQLPNTEKELVVAFMGFVGDGRMHGPYMAKKSTKPWWQYSATTRQALHVARVLLPYVRSKKKREDLQSVIDFYLEKDSGRARFDPKYRKLLVEKLKEPMTMEGIKSGN